MSRHNPTLSSDADGVQPTLRLSTLAIFGNALPDAVAILDRAGTIRVANPAFCALIRHPTAQLNGKRLVDLDGLAEIWTTIDAAVLRTGDDKSLTQLIERREMIISRNAQPILPVEVSANAIDDGKIRCFVVSIRDISKRTSFEAAMIEARTNAERANVAKSDLVAMVAHEIRTAANGVDGLLRLIEQEPDRVRRLSYLKSAQQCAGSLISIVGDILDLSKLEAGKFTIEPRQFDVSELLTTIDAFWRPQIEAKGLRFTIDKTATRAELVHGDDLRLCQILHNFISNGLKHTERGEIRLTVTDRDAGTRCFAVSDTGGGIPESEREKLFKPFEQCSGDLSTRLKGTGLGLAITRRLAEQMQGRAGVSSEVGKGSTFWVDVVLPDVEAPPKAQLAMTALPTVSPAHSHILIAEDNAVNRLLLKAQLGPRGYSITFATTGKEAITAVRAVRFDAIILDILLGDMRGDEVSAEIRQHEVGSLATPILGLTAFRRDELQANVVDAFDLLLEKGTDASALVARLDLAVACGRIRRDSKRPVIDETTLARLPARNREALLDLFVIELENGLRALDKATSEAALVAACHALAGVAANYGADRVATCARLVHKFAADSVARPFASRYLAEEIRTSVLELRHGRSAPRAASHSAI